MNKMPKEQLQIGDWWAPCCLHDLYHIETADDLDEAQHGMPYAGGWHTQQEAIEALLDPWIYSIVGEADRQEEIAYARVQFPDADFSFLVAPVKDQAP